MKHRLEEKFRAAGVRYGYCCCGCGDPTQTAKRSMRGNGYVVNEPRLYIHGHAAKRVNPDTEYLVEDRGYETPCWIWQASCNSTGYGLIYWRKTRGYAHRWFYERVHGKVPSRLHLDHLCRNRDCVNPDHLEPVSAAENVRRGLTRTTLTLADAHDIYRRASNGELQIALATEYGISKQHVSGIVCGRVWKDVAAAAAR